MFNLTAIKSTLLSIVQSFYSIDLYQRVAQQWQGIATKYLIALLALVLFPVSLAIHSKFDHFARHKAVTVIKQLPTITLKGGRLSIDRPVPFHIQHPDTAQTLLVIDTSRSADELLLDSNASIIISAREIVHRDEQIGLLQRSEIKQIPDMEIDKIIVNELLQTINRWFFFIIYPVMLLTLIIMRLVHALFNGLLGLIYGKLRRITLSYKQLIRLAVVSLTPLIVIDAMFTIFGMQFSFQGVFYMLVSFAYLIFAIEANRTQGSRNEVQERG